MDNRDTRANKHVFPRGTARAERFELPPPNIEQPTIPPRAREVHGSRLLSDLATVRELANSARMEQYVPESIDSAGVQVEFESFPDVELAFESLAREHQGIELLNVRHFGNRTFATVFVPDGRLEHFERLVGNYLEEKRDRNGRPRDSRRLIDAIRSIRAATLRALWTDEPSAFPVDADERFWWEVWLPIRGERNQVVTEFRESAAMIDVRVADGELRFPERTIVLAYASAEQMQRSSLTLNSIAELRRAKETAEFFDSLPSGEQPEWLDDLLGRVQYPDNTADTPYVCILDTGVARAHPLIAPALASSDLHTIEPGWGADDQHGHGTSMAGLALAGDLTALLDSNTPVELRHGLESVKLLPDETANGNDPIHHGQITVEAVARPEIAAPERLRVFGMAVTARDNRDRGRPSAWSSAIDRLAADADEDGDNPRLFVVSAGNVTDQNAWPHCPDSNTTDSIHDPAQAWNALTVGACTHLTTITEDGCNAYSCIAPSGGLSPFSTTSVTWERHWPLKPDILLEGGNAAQDVFGAVWLPSLSLLTTHHQPTARLFTTANATSAATALAARMAAQIMAEYPELRPETIRGLMVHSAEWTEAMRQGFLPRTRSPGKRDYHHLIRHCGYGVPAVERALWSLSNSLTMVIEERLAPFMREAGAAPKLGNMHLHELPWPREELEALGETTVEMRVTLSYFIEPNPSRRGVRSRYRYESHGLRFEVKRPGESLNAFRARINAAARQDDTERRGGDTDPNWLIGRQARHRGSIHSDIWRGTAADLASRGALAVYPSTGWWKTRPRLEKYNNVAPYSLIVSIHAPAVEVDLYTAVAAQVAVPVSVGI